MLHPLLKRQLKKHLPEGFDQGAIASFINAVNSSYEHYEEDRKLMEHSIDINSKEMVEMYEEQRKVREEIEALFDSMDEVYFTIDSDSNKLMLISPGCQKLYGYSQSEFYSGKKLWYSMIHPDDRKQFKGVFSRLRAGESVVIEYRIQCPDGRMKWVEAKIKPYRNTDNIIKINGVALDITGRKLYESTIRENEDRFRAIINSSHDLVQSINTTGRFEFVNSTWLNTMGYTIQDLTSMDAFDIIDPTHLEHCMSSFMKVMEGESINAIHTRMIRKDGKIVVLAGKIVPRMLDGKCIGSMGFFQDVTEKERIENEKAVLVQSIIRSEEKFRSLFDNSRDPILTLDENNIFVNCNNAAVSFLKAECKEQIIGLRPIDISPLYQSDGNLSSEKLLSMYKAAFENGNIQFEWQHTRMDGTVADVEISLSKIPVDNKHILLLHCRDITERLKAEKEFKRQYLELQKANSELDRFVYSVSHDLRAPLCSVMGLTELIIEDVTEAEIKVPLEMIRNNVDKLDQFIRDILNYSRNSRLSPRLEKLDCHALIRDITDNLRFMNNGVKVNFNVHVKAAVPVVSDSSRLIVILNNLLSNSIRYYDPAKKSVEISITVLADDDIIDLIVEDNGSGIQKEQLPKIFDMFYRATETSAGSGLGLYIVKESVNKLKGSIEVSSEVGKGTRFIISLPNTSLLEH